jgi:cob(I)alamin adenosyltransferase
LVKLNKIYTRTGDDGTTGLVDGSRVAKHDARMEAIGAVDEANSAIGLAICAVVFDHHAALHRIQNDLFDLGADLATPARNGEGEDFTPSPMVLRMVAAQTDWLERAMDALNDNLPALTSFILPGGDEGAARVHVARAAARRAERAMVALGLKRRSIRKLWPISIVCPIISSFWRARSMRKRRAMCYGCPVPAGAMPASVRIERCRQ